MRYHLMLRGKRTTITVDENLSAYLLQRIGGYEADWGINSKVGKKAVMRWINRQVKLNEANLPDKNISQWVQVRIIHEIADPVLRDKLDKQPGAREKILTQYGN